MNNLLLRAAGLSPCKRPMSKPLIACVLCFAALPSCIVPPKPIESNRQRHVLILPGIGGSPIGLSDTQALRTQIEREMPGVSAQVWDWTAVESRISITKIDNLTDYARNRRRASILARDIECWTRRHPGSPLYLLAQSGGAGIALFACEELPPDVTLEGIIIVSGGVSTAYDLTQALAHTRLGVFNYYSPKDVHVLRDGTTRHGTMDRRYGPSAGYAGFDMNDPKLFQLPWDPSMRRFGNRGGHSSGLRPAFARRYILPLIRPDAAANLAEWRNTRESKREILAPKPANESGEKSRHRSIPPSSAPIVKRAPIPSPAHGPSDEQCGS